MSKENIVKFQARLMESPELQQKLKDARTPEAIIAAAETEGFDFSTEELEEYCKTVASKGKLADEELNEVTGGVFETTVAYGCKYWEARKDTWWAAKGCCGSCSKYSFVPLPQLMYIGVPGLCLERRNGG